MQKIGNGVTITTVSLTDEALKIADDAAANWGIKRSEAIRRILAEWDAWQNRISRNGGKPTK